jgi:hypothetical protein
MMGTTRHLLPRKTPWLYFHRDHPLGNDWRRYQPRDPEEEDYWDQEERFAWLLDDEEDAIDLNVTEQTTWTMTIPM